MNRQSLQNLKGFRDFLGQDSRRRQWMLKKIRTVFELFGFEPLETPTLEYESLLLGKYGAEADKLIYGFEDRGGRRVALRYDQTVPTARIVAQYQSKLVFPYKRYQMQNVWRADKPQKGRFREFTQCDIDIIGSVSAISDSEVLAVTAGVFKELGFASIQLKVNDREQLIASIVQAGIGKDLIFPVIQSIDKLDKKSETEVIEELIEKGIAKDSAIKLIEQLNNGTMSNNLKAIVDQAVAMGLSRETFVYAPTLARGLDYYTGLIFEAIIPEFPVGSVAGGGRYDNLIKDLVGVEMPAVGMAIGFDRTLEAAIELNKIPNFTGSAEYLVTVFSPDLMANSLAVATHLRQKGIATEVYLGSSKKLESQFKFADAKGIPFVIVLGPDELKRGVVKVKTLATRAEKEITIDEITTSL